MAAGEGQGEDWQAFLKLGDAEDEEAPPALAAQPALVEDDDDDLPPPAHAGIDVPPALPVLPQGEVLGMIGELVDPVGPAAAHGADPPVHGAYEDPAPLLPPQQQQPAGVPPIGGLLVGQPAVVMLMQQQDEPVLVLDEPVLVLDEEALKALADDLLGQHGPAAADDGAHLPVDGVPAPPLAPPPSPPLAPPPPPQQQPVPVVLIDNAREEDLDVASEIWNEQKQQALKALEDGPPGQHGPAAADDGADPPVDGVPAPPLAPPPPPPQQQHPVPVVLIDNAREEDLDVASEIWTEKKQQALKRPQNELLGPAPAKRPAMAAMDMSAPPAPPGGGGGSDIVAVAPSFPMIIPGFMHSTTMAHQLPPQVALLGPGIGGIMHSAMPSNFDMKGDPRGGCKACPPGHGRIQHQSKVCGYTEPPNALSQHYCLCEPCQDRPPLESLRLRYVHCRTCREWFRLKQAQGPQ